MESKHMKRYSTSVAMREMYIKTHMRYYSIPIRITKIKNESKKKSQGTLENTQKLMKTKTQHTKTYGTQQKQC